MMNSNFFNLQVHDKQIVVRSMTAYSKLNKFIRLHANWLFQQSQKLYIHSFSLFYDILFKRKVLIQNNGCIDYFRKKIVFSGRTFLQIELELCDGNSLKNVEAIIQENHFTAEINYALDNDINSDHTYRLVHLNNEEKYRLEYIK